jgi:maleylpyruvate isomerase
VPSLPSEFLCDAVASATTSLLTSVDGLDPAAVADATELPGWTRGHVLTHIARNADALLRMLIGALGETSLPMYPSMDARNADIETGARRPPEVVFEDVHITAETLGVAIGEVPPAVWSSVVVLQPPHGRIDAPVAEILEMRLREVEIHHVDLGVGHDFSSTPAALLDHLIASAAERFGGRLVAPLALHVADTGARYTIIGTDTSATPIDVELPAAVMYRQLTGRLLPDDEPGALPGLPPWR